MGIPTLAAGGHRKVGFLIPRYAEIQMTLRSSSGGERDAGV